MDVQLTRAEVELQQEESALATELARLAAVSRELQTRLHALGQDSRLPVIDAEHAFTPAAAARQAAIVKRRETHQHLKQQVAALKAHLQKAAQQLLADEKAAHEAQAAARARPPPVAARAPAPAQPPAPAARPAPAQSADEKKRTSQRVRMQAAVDFNSDNNFYNGFSANISDGGLFVATVNLLPLGTEVDLAFSLPSGAKIEAKGVVRWVREVNDKAPDVFPGLGVQFSRLDPQAQSAIDQFLAERDPLFFTE